MIVDRRQMEAQQNLIQSGVGQIVGRPLMNISLCFHFEIIANPVHLVDEHLELDARIHLVGFGHRLVEFRQRLNVIIASVNDEHQGATTAEDHVRVEGGIEEIDLAGEIPDLELDEAAVVDVVLDDFVRRLEEQCFVGRHLVEDDLLNGTFATASQSHQQDPGFAFAAHRIRGLPRVLVKVGVTKVLGKGAHIVVAHLLLAILVATLLGGQVE